MDVIMASFAVGAPVAKINDAYVDSTRVLSIVGAAMSKQQQQQQGQLGTTHDDTTMQCVASIFQEPGGPSVVSKQLMLVLGCPSSYVLASDRLAAADGLVYLCTEQHCRAFVNIPRRVKTLHQLMGIDTQEVVEAASYCIWAMVSRGGTLYLEVLGAAGGLQAVLALLLKKLQGAAHAATSHPTTGTLLKLLQAVKGVVEHPATSAADLAPVGTSMAHQLINRALGSVSGLPIVGDEAVVIGDDEQETQQAQRFQLACLEAVQQLLVKSLATSMELVQAAPVSVAAGNEPAAGHLLAAAQGCQGLLALVVGGSPAVREQALRSVLELAGSGELREAVVAAAIEAPGWLAALLDLICSHPPARQPGLQLLTTMASCPRHWSALLQDAAVLQLHVGLGSSALAEQPGLSQQVRQLFEVLTAQADTSQSTVMTSFDLCTNEQLMRQRISMCCQACGSVAALPELLLAMLATENTAAVRRVLLDAGVLDYILQEVQRDDETWEPSSKAAVKLFSLLLSSELEASGTENGDTAAARMGQKAVEAGAFSAWLQQLQSAAFPAAAAVQEAIALVMAAYPAHVTEASDREGVLPVLLGLLRHALVGAAAGEDAELSAEDAWFQDRQLPRQQWLLASTVLDGLAALCSNATAATAAMASTLPQSTLDLPSLLGLMLQHWPWAAQGCMAVMMAANAAEPEASRAVLAVVGGQPGVLGALLQQMLYRDAKDEADCAAHLVGAAILQEPAAALRCRAYQGNLLDLLTDCEPGSTTATTCHLVLQLVYAGEYTIATAQQMCTWPAYLKHLSQDSRGMLEQYVVACGGLARVLRDLAKCGRNAAPNCAQLAVLQGRLQCLAAILACSPKDATGSLSREDPAVNAVSILAGVMEVCSGMDGSTGGEGNGWYGLRDECQGLALALLHSFVPAAAQLPASCGLPAEQAPISKGMPQGIVAAVGQCSNSDVMGRSGRQGSGGKQQEKKGKGRGSKGESLKDVINDADAYMACVAHMQQCEADAYAEPMPDKPAKRSKAERLAHKKHKQRMQAIEASQPGAGAPMAQGQWGLQFV